MYYFIEISNVTNGTAKAITEKPGLQEAEMQFHQTLASAMANPDVSSCMVMIIDSRGAVQRYEYRERPAGEGE